MKFLILVVFGLVSINLSYADVYINEIMYNPVQNENYNEWIELYNNDSVDLDISNLTICETNINLGYINRSGNIFLNSSSIIKAEGYAIITDGGSGTEVYENFNITNETIAFHVEANSICGGLSNSGKELTYTFLGINYSVNYSDTVYEGYSLELVNGSFIQSYELGGTPGRLNTGIYNDSLSNISNSSNSTETSEISIDISISNNNFSLNELINITGNITSSFSSLIYANLTIKIARNISGSWSYKWYVLVDKTINISNSTTINNSLGYNLNWTVPNDFIIGNYKILATLSYYDNNTLKHRYSDQFFFVNGLTDLGEYNMTIVSYPSSMGFGEISKVLIKLESNNYNIKNASFVAYIYDPKWVTIDFSDNTLMTRPYSTNVAVKFDEITRGTTNYVSLPILTKRNCEDDYSNGDYKAKVRLYENDDEIIENFFNITIRNEKNNDMCPVSETKYVSSKSSGSSVSTSTGKSHTEIGNEEDSKDEISFTYDQTEFEIIIPKISKSNNIEINVRMRNKMNESKEFDMWSYVNQGKKLVSNRYENKKKISLNAFEDKSLKLINLVENEKFESSTYKAYVKVNSSNRKSEKTVSQNIVFLNEEKTKTSPKVKDFKIRTKKFSENIIMVSGCENIINQSNYSLNLYSFDVYEKKACNQSLEFEIKLKNEFELFFLIIEKEDKVFDVKKIFLERSNNSIILYNETEDMYNKIGAYNKLSNINGFNLLTGDSIKSDGVIYESINEKVKKLIKYAFITIFIVGVIIYLRKDYG